MPIFQKNIAPSLIPLAPQHPVEEDEDRNTGARLGVEDEDETESEMAPPRANSEQRSKSNHYREAAREGSIRGTKGAISPSRGESSGKAAALSPSHGKVAPMKQRKTLSTLGGRKVSASTVIPKASKKSSELDLLKLLLPQLLLQDGLSRQLGSNLC